MAAHAQAVSRLTELVEIAQETPGWGVTHGAKHVYFVPPREAGTDNIQMSVHPGELNIKRLEKTLGGLGLPLSKPKRPAHPAGTRRHVQPASEQPEPEQPQVEPVQPSLVCPECGQPAKSPAGLGAHRRRKHGVLGGGPDAVRARRRAEEGEPVVEQPEQPDVTHGAAMANLDEAWALLRSEVDAVVLASLEAPEAAEWQRRAEEAGEVLAQVREAIQTLPMAQAYARIAEVVGADRA